MTQDEAKLMVGRRAAEFVEDGMIVGLGTGTTSVMFIRELGARVQQGLKIRCVASSNASAALATSLGMDVRSLAELPELDVYIDGADEIGPGLSLIKGGGGALLREKIVASSAKRFIVVADSTKIVDTLGRFPLPVEVIKMALPLVERKLAALGLNPKQRLRKDGSDYLTDEQNFILDCACGQIADPAATAAAIRAIVGVVEHGLFLNMATVALIAGEDGVTERKNRSLLCIAAAIPSVCHNMANLTNNSQAGKVWFITGASSGFGRLLAEYLLSLGANVVATARKPDVLEELTTKYPANLQILALDVTKPSQVDKAVNDALARFGHIDVLVNNAGYGVTGAFEEVSAEEYMPMFETNVFGPITLTKALLPQFRARRSGNIVNLSSIGGLVGLPGWSMYNATKFALEGFSEALAIELEPLGIYVTIIEPGPFRTEFLGTSGIQAKHQIADYATTAGKTREYFQSQNGKQAGDPQKAVEAIVAAASASKPPRHLLLGKLALERYRAKMKVFDSELSEWEPVTLDTDFPESK